MTARRSTFAARACSKSVIRSVRGCGAIVARAFVDAHNAQGLPGAGEMAAGRGQVARLNRRNGRAGVGRNRDQRELEDLRLQKPVAAGLFVERLLERSKP